MQSASLSARRVESAAAVTNVPLFDMSRQYEGLKLDIAAAIARVCGSSQFILGPECQLLEQELAAYSQVQHAVGCASGSDALLLAMMALGIGAGDEVIMPSYTFFATASAAWRLGAKPVFVDIEPAHYNINPRLVEAAITPATKAILPVHLYGQCAEMTPLVELAHKHKLPIIEDAAQAVGAEYNGRRAGSLGAVGCLSFYPTKNLGGFGDGGMLLTGDGVLAEKLKLLRGHGMQPRYYHRVVGINSRLDSIQASVLRVKLAHLDDWTARRQANAARYAELFAHWGLDRVLGLPFAAENCRHVWNQYVIRVPDGRRDSLREHLKQHGVGSEIYYPVPVHLQECFRPLGHTAGSLPETELAAAETIALPIFPELTAEEQSHVVRSIGNYFGVQKPASTLRGPKWLKG